MNGKYCAPTKPMGKSPAKTMQSLFGKAPANPSNLAKKLGPAPTQPKAKK